MLAAQADHDQRHLRDGRVDDWDRLVISAETLAEAEGSVGFYDVSDLSTTALRSKIRQLKTTGGVDLVIVDYLQLMHALQPDGKRFVIREQEIAEISRSLKAAAKELDVPVLALAQLNRGLELRSNKRPMLADLRESGSLENDADVVLFIYRPDLYEETNNPDTKNIADIIIA